MGHPDDGPMMGFSVSNPRKLETADSGLKRAFEALLSVHSAVLAVDGRLNMNDLKRLLAALSAIINQAETVNTILVQYAREISLREKYK